MRSAINLGVALLMASAASAADEPIPQDTAKMEKHRREALDWNRRTMEGAYDKIGKRDPKWDKPAREALRVAAEAFSRPGTPLIVQEGIRRATKAAVDAGCDDPMVAWLYNRARGGQRYPATPAMKASAEALGSSRYPAFRRALALSASVAEDRSSTKADVDAALALLTESLASDERNEFWEQRWSRTLRNLIRGYRNTGIPALAAYERIDERLAKEPGLEVLRLQVRGRFWLHYGWEARTRAFAPDVPAEGAAAFETRLIEARKALDEAWRLRPDSSTAEDRLEIEKGIGGGDRPAMETWFERAMKADGDNRDACWSKLDWLTPQWHGDERGEEMLAFGKACRDTKNSWAGITMLACDAHYRFAAMLVADDRKYLSSPAVWSEIQAVYEEYLKHYPTDDIARTKYATLAFLSDHDVEAHVQFQAVGDRLAPWSEFPYLPLQALEKIRGYAAGQAEVKEGIRKAVEEAARPKP